MEIKQLVTKYVYRIEPKPDGGFIARCTDPNVPPLEAPTRAELQQKIHSTVMAGLAQDFPGLKFPLQTSEARFSFHVEGNSDGGIDIHSSDPNAVPITVGTHDEVESHFAEKLLGFVGKHLTPELAQALAAKGISGDLTDVKVFVSKTGFTVTKSGEAKFGHGKFGNAAFGSAQTLPGSAYPTIDGATISNSSLSSSSGTLSQSSMNDGPITRGPISSSPITPGNGRSGATIRFLFALLFLAAVAYLLLHHR